MRKYYRYLLQVCIFFCVHYQFSRDWRMRGAVLVQLLRTLVVPVKAVGLSLQTKQPSSSLLCRQLFIPSPHPFIRRKPLHEVNVQCFHLIPHVPTCFFHTRCARCGFLRSACRVPWPLPAHGALLRPPDACAGPMLGLHALKALSHQIWPATLCAGPPAAPLLRTARHR